MVYVDRSHIIMIAMKSNEIVIWLHDARREEEEREEMMW